MVVGLWQKPDTKNCVYKDPLCKIYRTVHTFIKNKSTTFAPLHEFTEFLSNNFVFFLKKYIGFSNMRWSWLIGFFFIFFILTYEAVNLINASYEEAKGKSTKLED